MSQATRKLERLALISVHAIFFPYLLPLPVLIRPPRVHAPANMSQELLVSRVLGGGSPNSKMDRDRAHLYQPIK